MRGRPSLYVLLASSLTFLASLFLPWRETRVSDLGGGTLGLLNLFAVSGREIDGWIPGAGDVAVLLVVALVFATIAALRRPRLAARLPLGGLGVALAYFAAAVALGIHAQTAILSHALAGRRYTFDTSWSYGFYLGLASAAVAGLCGLSWSGRELLRRRGAADAVAVALGIVVLVSFLLPWIGFSRPNSSFSYPGIESPAAMIAALGLILGAGRLLGDASRRWRLPFALATAILAGAAASSLPPFGTHRYGTWIGVGCALLLVGVETLRAWPVRLPALPRGLAAVRTGAAALLIVSLFLPWEVLDAHTVNEQANDGWYLVVGTAAGSLCLLLLATPALRVLESYVLDVVVAVVVLVSALATAFRQESFAFGIGYGAFVGIAAAGILLVTTLVRLRAGRLDPARARASAVPLAMSVLCAVAIVLPLWFVLPRDWTSEASPLDYGSWLAVAGLLLALYLVRLWALRINAPVSTGLRLTLVPLAIFTLASLELIRFRGEVVWGAVILVGLCLLLALLGWIEEHGGLEGLRVPEEIWRVDRLPEPES